MYPLFSRPEEFSMARVLKIGVEPEVWYERTPYSFIEVILQQSHLLAVIVPEDDKTKVEGIFNSDSQVIEMDKLGEDDVYIIMRCKDLIIVIESNVTINVPSFGYFQIDSLSDNIKELMDGHDDDLVRTIIDLICDCIRGGYVECDISDDHTSKYYRIFSLEDE